MGAARWPGLRLGADTDVDRVGAIVSNYSLRQGGSQALNAQHHTPIDRINLRLPDMGGLKLCVELKIKDSVAHGRGLGATAATRLEGHVSEKGVTLDRRELGHPELRRCGAARTGRQLALCEVGIESSATTLHAPGSQLPRPCADGAENDAPPSTVGVPKSSGFSWLSIIALPYASLMEAGIAASCTGTTSSPEPSRRGPSVGGVAAPLSNMATAAPAASAIQRPRMTLPPCSTSVRQFCGDCVIPECDALRRG